MSSHDLHRLDQLEAAGDEDTYAAVAIARAALARVTDLEQQLTWLTGGSSGWAEPTTKEHTK